MDEKKRTSGKKKAGAIIAAVFVLIYVLFYFSFLVWAGLQQPEAFGVIAIILVIPLLIAIGVLVALYQRMKEIEGGEEDEAAKY